MVLQTMAQIPALPASLPFVDYSGMSIDHGRVAVVSQVNSMLWVGQFDEAGWDWHNAGQLYEFPRSESGNIRYGNIEGVGWISPTRTVTVSDRRKKKRQPDMIKISPSISLIFLHRMKAGSAAA
jgi:hypothetical protein